MKIELNRVDDLNARVSVLLEQADYKSKLDENLKNYSKKVNLKGFRAGKTPKNVLTKMYGRGMLEETVNTMLNEKLFKYLEEERIDIFGSPILVPDQDPVDFNPKSLADYKFVFDIGLKPTFEPNYKFDHPLEIATVGSNVEAIDEDMVRYRRLFGEAIQVEDGSVEEFDRISVKLSRINDAEDHNAIEADIDLERLKGEAKDILLGKKAGDNFETDLEVFYGLNRDEILKSVLSLDNDPLPGEALIYNVEITGIKRPQSSELSGEQITKFTGQQIEDEGGLRTILEDREKGTNKTRTDDLKKMTIRLELLKANPFDIPEDFLVLWVNGQRDKKIEQGSRDAKNLFREAKWSLLLNKISADAGLEVTEKDVQKQVTKWIVENVNYMQTDIRKLMKELHENEYFMSTMKENAMEEVVFAHIMPDITFIEKEGSAKEFEHAFHDVHHELFDHEDHAHA